MNILLIEPYYTGSHKAWVDGFMQHSRHRVELLSMTGQFWKWRMQGGAVTIARLYRERGYRPDLILTTDMLDLASFLGLSRDLTHHIPVAVYFHENQLTYPLMPNEKRDLHYGLVNFTSALVADAVFFNSPYHRASFLSELPRLLKHFPDYNELWSVEAIAAKSQVLPVGLDLHRHDAYGPTVRDEGPPIILWNHRWEYDKNPGEFFRALYILQEMRLPFRVILLGQNVRQRPEEFLEARERLGERVIHFGYVPDFPTYSSLLWRSDIAISTSHHEFFGIATVEAIYCGNYPLLPNRLVYPDLIPQDLHASCLYHDLDELVTRLATFLSGSRPAPAVGRALREHVAQFDWNRIISVYDERLEAVAAN